MEVVKQEGIKDCGVCCLLSIIRHYNGDCSLEYLRDLTKTNKHGVTAYNLVNASIKLGFSSYGINTKINDIKIEMLPLIAHVVIDNKYQHFIVIYNIVKSRQELIIMDPSKGKLKMTFSEFNLISSDNYIYLKPIKKILKLERKKIVNKWLKQFIQKNKKFIPYILILTSIYNFLCMLCTFHFKIILNNAINYNVLENVIVITKIMLIIFILKNLFDYLKKITLLKWNEILDEELTMNVFKRLIFLPYLYYNNRTVGEVISRIKDLENIKLFLINLFSIISTDLILIFIYIYFSFYIEKILGIILITFSILLIIEEIIYNKIHIKKISNYLNSYDEINSILYETLSSMNTIKGMHLEKIKTNIFHKNYQTFLSNSYLINRNYITNNFSNNLITDLFQILILSNGAILIIKGKISISDLIIFQTISNYFLTALKNIISLYKDYYKYKISKTRIEELFTIKTENFNCLDFFSNYKLNGTICIKKLNYSFGYKKVFDNLTLKIKNKEKIFLTGESGSGKSTLMKILCRYLNIDYGYLTINNIDITHYHLDVIRRRITYTSQREKVFTGTIKENILIGGDDLNLEEICKITRVDQILDYNMMNDKIIEEGGNNLSGGEMQRIILARSLIRDSDIYIFDEALSQLDEEKEQEILKDILKYLKNKTVIVISHRLTSKYLFNKCLKLQDGQIYEDI